MVAFYAETSCNCAKISCTSTESKDAICTDQLNLPKSAHLTKNVHFDKNFIETFLFSK